MNLRNKLCTLAMGVCLASPIYADCVDINLKPNEQHLVLSGKANNKQLEVLIDSGSRHNYIPHREVKRLGVKDSMALTFGDTSFRIPIIEGEVQGIGFCGEIPTLLGMDFLKTVTTVINEREGNVTFYKDAPKEHVLKENKERYNIQEKLIIPLKYGGPEEGHWVVRAKFIKGNEEYSQNFTGTFVLDTGCGGAVAKSNTPLFQAVYKKMGWTKLPPNSRNYTHMGSKISGVEINGNKFPGYLSVGGFKLNSKGLDGIIGRETFKEWNVISLFPKEMEMVLQR